MMTKEGGKTLKATMIKKFGSEEAYKEYMRNMSAKGGKVKGIEKGFASFKEGSDGLTGRQRARVVGKTGGAISKRPSKKQ